MEVAFVSFHRHNHTHAYNFFYFLLLFKDRIRNKNLHLGPSILEPEFDLPRMQTQLSTEL